MASTWILLNVPASVRIFGIAENEVQIDADVSNITGATGFEVASSYGPATWQTHKTVGSFPTTQVVGTGERQVRVRAVAENGSSEWAYSNVVKMGQAPNFPAVQINGGALVVASGALLDLTWTPNTLDASPVTASQVEVTVGGSDPVTIDVEGDAEAATYQLSPSFEGQVSVRVRNQSHNGWGGWSFPVTAHAYIAPRAAFADTTVEANGLPATVEWTVTTAHGLSGQTLTLMDENLVPIQTIELGADARSYSFGSLENGKTYRVGLFVRDSTALTYTVPIPAYIVTSWQGPAFPTADVEVDRAAAAVELTVHVGQNVPFELSVEGITGTNYYTGQPAYPYPPGVTDPTQLPPGTYLARCRFERTEQGSGGGHSVRLSYDNSTGTGFFISPDAEWSSDASGTVDVTEHQFEIPDTTDNYSHVIIKVNGRADVVVTVTPVDVSGDLPEQYPATSGIAVARVNPDGSESVIASGLSDGDSVRDALPPINFPFAYRLTASAATGETRSADVDALLDMQVGAFNFGPDAGECIIAWLEPSWSNDVSRSSELYHFADGGDSGGLPVAYGGPDVDSTHSQGFALGSVDDMRSLQRLAASYSTCWYRDPYGGRYLVAASFKFSSGIPWDSLEASCDMTDTVFEEPLNG